MPSFQDGALIFFIALLLFGPKKLPELARYVGKLMGEFRRASSEFRLQMEDEFRLSEQAEQQKKVAAMEAAAPTPPALTPEPDAIPEPEHPHMPLAHDWNGPVAEENHVTPEPAFDYGPDPEPSPAPEPLPIATSGDLNLMPPATGLPVARNGSPTDSHADSPSDSLSGVFDSIPQASEAEPEATPHA